MRRYWPVAFILLCTSCMSQSSLDGLPLAELHPAEAIFYVEKQPADTHGLNEAIARILSARGLTAVTSAPETYDYRITYIDRWYWDMRMYMIDFRIDVRDPDTNLLLATARSYQTSLAAMGKGRETIIRNTVTILFEGPQPPAQDSESRGASPGHRRPTSSR